MLGAGESKEPVPLASVLKRRRAQPERHEDAGGSRPQKGVGGAAWGWTSAGPPLLALAPVADASDRSRRSFCLN